MGWMSAEGESFVSHYEIQILLLYKLCFFINVIFLIKNMIHYILINLHNYKLYHLNLDKMFHLIIFINVLILIELLDISMGYIKINFNKNS